MEEMQNEFMKEKIRSLYENWSDEIYRYLCFHVKNKQLAEELTQETYLRAFKGISNFKNESIEKTWLFSIARHVKLDYFRKKRVESLFFIRVKDTQEHVIHPLEELERNERRDLLYQAIRRLKPNYQEVIFLRKIKEYSIKETAEILGWSESKIKNILARALRALEAEMRRRESGE